MQSTTFTINLRKRLLRLHTARRRKRATGLVREAVARFAKSDPEKIKINRELSEFIAKNASGASYMWSKLKVSVDKNEDKVEVRMYSTKSPAAPQAAQKGKGGGKKEEKGKEAAKEKKEPKQQKQAQA